MTVDVKYDRDDLLTDYAVGMLKDFYMMEGETSPQDAYARASTAWATFQGDLHLLLHVLLISIFSHDHLNFHR